MNRLKFRFTCITLILLLAAFISSGLNIFNIKSMWAAPTSQEPVRFMDYSPPYLGPQLASPLHGSIDCPVTALDFAWVQFKDYSEYKFVLATDPAVTEIIDEAQVSGCNYWYNGTLNYSTEYFWHVMAVGPTLSDWSVTWSFQTKAAPPVVKSPDPLPAIPIAIVLVEIVTAVGFISWFIIARRNKAKQ